MVCLEVDFFRIIHFGVHSAFSVSEFVNSAKFGNFSVIMFSNTFNIFQIPFLFSLWDFSDTNVGSFVLSQRSLRLWLFYLLFSPLFNWVNFVLSSRSLILSPVICTAVHPLSVVFFRFIIALCFFLITHYFAGILILYLFQENEYFIVEAFL